MPLKKIDNTIAVDRLRTFSCNDRCQPTIVVNQFTVAELELFPNIRVINRAQFSYCFDLILEYKNFNIITS